MLSNEELEFAETRHDFAASFYHTLHSTSLVITIYTTRFKFQISNLLKTTNG